MSLSNRDYMRKATDDERKVDAYEEAVRTQEYGDFSAQRTGKIKKAALLIIALFIVLIIASFVVSRR